MTDKERKIYITQIALAIGILADTAEAVSTREKIRYFADAIINLAEKSDARIANNKEQFDSILFEAKEINNRRT